MSLLASLAVLRVHVLVVELPGRPALRLRAEAAVRARGWIVTTAPADADLLLVCGTPRTAVAAGVEALWWRVPAPRARRSVRSVEDLPAALDSAARVLADAALQRRAAADAPPAPEDVDVPGRFGPLRPDWPAGLALDCAIGVDGRVAAVGTSRIEPEAEADAILPGVLAAADAARLLRLAGWAVPALRLDRAVDLALEEPSRLPRRARAVARLVRRSSTLRWALAGDVREVDVRARLLALLDAAASGKAPPVPPERALPGLRPEVVPTVVAATEPSGA